MDAFTTSTDIASLTEPLGKTPLSATPKMPVMTDGDLVALDFSQSPTASSCRTDDANFAAVTRRDARSIQTETTTAHSASSRTNTRALVVSCPHAGRLYPAEFVTDSALELAALRDLEDYAVDWLIEGMMAHNITAITNHVGRAFLDVNRPADALDKIMFADNVDAATPSRQVKAGYGLLPRLNAARLPIHNMPLSGDEAQRRLEMVHAPYHRMLAETLETALAHHGHYLLLDIHSMPETDRLGRPLADFVLGDCLGTTIDSELGTKISNFIADSGFSVAWNKPYAGGHITREYGRINSPRQSVQIEINRALYMKMTPMIANPALNEITLKAEGAARVATMLGALGAMLANMLDNHS